MTTIRIVALSDSHSQHKRLIVPQCDVLLHAGDATVYGSEKETNDFLTWFDAQPAKYKFLVPGNHDSFLQQHPMDKFGSVKLLYGKRAVKLEEFDNVKVFGMPGVLLPSEDYRGKAYWAFGEAENELERRWKCIPKDTDILLTHSPPHGILDTIWNGSHVGSPSLMQRVQKTDVQLHVFGHIHEAAGYLQLNGRHFVNASVTGLYHKLAHSPRLIDFIRLSKDSFRRNRK